MSATDGGGGGADGPDGQPRERRYLVQKPVAQQYFCRGRLYKMSEKERVGGRFELFLDLLYVALIANFADHLAEEPSGDNLVIFILTFVPAWHAWADIKEVNNIFYNDDVSQRIGILWVMALLVLYGNNANDIGDSLEAQRTTVGAYMVIRLTQLSVHFVYSLANKCLKYQTRTYAGLTFVGLFIWIPIFFEDVSTRAKIAVAVVAIAWEQFTYALAFGPYISRWFNLDYNTAVDIDHENDRYTAFTIIVLGEFTYAILVGSPAKGGLNLNLLRAVWTLVIAFCFNSMYVYNCGAIEVKHPVRRSVSTAYIWLLIHLPMAAGLLIGGHVSAASTGEDELSSGKRWLWGGGLGLGMLCMWICAQVYQDCDEPGLLAMRKQFRLAPRLAVALIYVLLPLASEEELSSTSLVSIGAALSAFVVIWETVGALECGAHPFESWRARVGPGSEMMGIEVPDGHIVKLTSKGA